MSILETRDFSVAYGGVRAVRSVSISLEAKTIVGMIGPNGAGKTSLLDGISGLTASSGHVLFDGTDISNDSPHRRARLGLRRTWQSGELFDDLTVGENLAVSVMPSASEMLAEILMPSRRRSELRSLAESTLDIFGLGPMIDEMPSALPLGVQKLVGVARSLASKPRVLVLDEPAAGLDKFESRAFGQHLAPIASEGVAIMLIDHDMELVLGVCDYVYVLDFGEVIAEGAPEEIRADEKVLTAYLGRDSAAVGTVGDGSDPPSSSGSVQ